MPGSESHSRAFPQPITLPATLEIVANECVIIDVQAPTGVIVTDDPSSSSLPPSSSTPWYFHWFQGLDERIFGKVTGVQAESGPLIACAVSWWSGGTVTFMAVALDDERLGDVCLDEQHKRVDDEVEACPANTVCSTRLNEPQCRGGVGNACTYTCSGSCLNDGETNTCLVDRLAPDDRALCDGIVFQEGSPWRPQRNVCSERCEDLLGCVVSPGQPCFRFEWCIDPITLDDITTCPDTGVCPEVAQ